MHEAWSGLHASLRLAGRPHCRTNLRGGRAAHGTDELEASRDAEARLRQHTRDAIHAAEAEAHRKVEDSYQEASFAVQKALERVDAAAGEAAEAAARAKAFEGGEAAARAELRAAQEEAGRCAACVGGWA